MHNFESLFRRFVNGQCSAQEKEALFDMIARAENDEALARLIDEVIAQTGGEMQVKEEKAGEILSLILHTRPAPARRFHLRSIIRRAAVAAAFIAAAAAAWWYWPRESATTPLRQALTVQNIPPASKGAILTLGNGRIVPLDSLGQGVIARQGGTTITLAKGTVAYNAAAAGEASYNTLRTPRGKLFHLVLPDGSDVWLNAASSLRFPTRFSGDERVVELSGEACFDIRPNASMPFRVKLGNQEEVRVLGTTFNINAYENEGPAKTTLLQGSVALKAASGSSILRPGQQGTFLAAKILVEQADTAAVMAWRNGIFNFEQAHIKTVMQQLERWYDIEAVYENGVPDIVFGGKLERSLPLGSVLRILEISNVHYRLEGRKLIITQ